MDSKILLKNIEIIFLHIERRRYYEYVESERPEKYDNKYLLCFAIECLNHFIENNDFRYLNLALKIKDSIHIVGDKRAVNKLSKELLENTLYSFDL